MISDEAVKVRAVKENPTRSMEIRKEYTLLPNY